MNNKMIELAVADISKDRANILEHKIRELTKEMGYNLGDAEEVILESLMFYIQAQEKYKINASLAAQVYKGAVN